MLTLSTSLQSSSCKSVVPCMHRLHQFLSALALGLGLIKLMQPLHAWYIILLNTGSIYNALIFLPLRLFAFSHYNCNMYRLHTKGEVAQ